MGTAPYWRPYRGTALSLILVFAAGPSRAHAQDAPFLTDPGWLSGPADQTNGAALGDINGDGALDLVCANAAGSNALYLNQGGSFSTTPVWSSGPTNDSWNVALGDMDGDGDLDLVCANFPGKNTLYLNEGGTFSDEPAWSSGPSVQTFDVALGDVDGDGDLDIAFANSGNNTLYLNEGGGTFPTEPTWISTPRKVTLGVALGDVDHDGDLDLVFGNQNSGDALYRNEGDSVATSPVWESSFRSETSRVALGDVDGDGDLDLACGAASFSGGKSNTLYRNEGGTFSDAPVWLSVPANVTGGVALGDVDGDGDLDLACANRSGNMLYLNEGGALATIPAWVSGPANATVGVAFGDVDGDGDIDLVFANSGQSNTLYRNVRGAFSPTPDWYSGLPKIRADPTTNATVAVALGDINGDGDLDLVCGNWGDQSNTLYLNRDGWFRTMPAWSSGPGNRTESVTLGDVDGDGDVDLACGNSGQSNTVYLNVGTTFSMTPAWSSGPANETLAVEFGDVDGNGDLDLVCGNSESSNTLYLNEAGTFAIAPAWFSEPANVTGAVALGDVDGDGDLDLVCGNQDQSNTLYLGEGGTFSTSPIWSSVSINETHSVELGDVDGDGDLDLVCANVGQSNTLYLNEGGTFTPTPVWSSGPTNLTFDATLEDVDGDGWLDLACGNAGQSNTLYINEGGTFSTAPAWSSGTSNQTSAVAVGDIDGDGDADLACGNSGESNTLYWGLKDPAFKGTPPPPNGPSPYPTQHLPNNAAHLRWVSVRESEATPNLRIVEFQVIDVESDSVRVVPEFQYRGEPVWTLAATTGRAGAIGPLESSPAGVEHAFEWDVSLLPFDDRDVVLRLRTVSNPARAGLILHVPSYNLVIGPVVPSRPELVPPAAALDLGTVTVGDTVSVDFVLSNVGNQVLRIDDIAPPSPEMWVSKATPFDIAEGAIDSLTAFLAPRTVLIANGDLDISSNDPTALVLGIPVTADIRNLNVETNALTGDVEIPLGQALTIQVIPAAEVNVERGALFHRAAAPDTFATVELSRVGSSFIGVIPNEAVTELGLEYYVVVENSGVFRFDPPGAPDDSVFTQAVASPSRVTAVPQAGTGGRFFSGDDITVALELDDGTVFVDGVLRYRRGGESDFQSAPISMGESGVGGVVPGAYVGPRGVEYWVGVQTATDSLTDPATTPGVLPKTIPVTVLNLAEPSSHAGSVYRTLSLPLNFDSPEPIEAILADQTEFGPYDPKRWQAWTYVNADQRYVGVADGAAPQQMRPVPGRAFWLISKDPHRVNTAPLSARSPSSVQEMSLTPGWTMLGHPFAYPVAWDLVTATVTDVPIPVDSLLTGPFRWSAGQYDVEFADRLEPFEGYWIHNAGDETVLLRIPAVESVAAATRRGIIAAASERSVPPDWTLALAATGSKGARAEVLIGARADARDTYDPSDRLAPPPSPGPWIRFGADQERWGRRAGLYWRDLRARNKEGHRFDLIVRSSTVDEARVAVSSPANLPPGFDLRLIDREQEISIDPRDGDYRFVSFGENPYRLVLLAGTSEFVAEEAGAIVELPSTFVLGQNAPNPFRAATRVGFGLPTPGRVAIDVFDIRGAHVATLVNASLPVGYHVAIWDGRDQRGRRVAAGVYFYRMKTPEQTLTRKMARLR